MTNFVGQKGGPVHIEEPGPKSFDVRALCGIKKQFRHIITTAPVTCSKCIKKGSS